MNKCHTPIHWQNNTTPAINDTNLNYEDGCIDTIDDRVVAMDTSKLEAEDIENVIANVTMDDETGIFTFTKYDGSTFTIDTKLEKIAVNFRYDTATQKLIITLDDGTTQEVDLSSLIHETDFADSSTIVWTVTNHVATASIKANSIGDAQMQTGYLTDAQNAKNGAELAATSANTSRLESEGWAVGKQDGVDVPSTSPYYHNNAKYYAEYAGGQSLSGLTDVQISEVEDGQALVYDEVAEKWVNRQIASATAVINVSTDDSSLIDETVTLSLGGTEVATAEFDANKTCQFVVRSVGNYTVSVNGYSASANVTALYQTYNVTITTSTEITLTVEGAKEDTITILDSNGETVGSAIFTSGATSAQVTLDINDGDTYTFRSSLVDAPYGAGKFEKDVVLTAESTSVKVMPSDDVAYWYGNNKKVSETTIRTESSISDLSQSNVSTVSSTNPTQFIDATNYKAIKLGPTTTTSSGVTGQVWFAIDATSFNASILRFKCKRKQTISNLDGSRLYQLAFWNSNPNNQNVSNNIGRIYADRDANEETSINERVDISSYIGKWISLGFWGSNDACTMYELDLEAMWFESIRSIPSPSEAVTLTVEGAKEDKITVYDRSWNVVAYVDFASGQTSASASLNIKSGGEKLIFASSVSDYAKEVLVTSATTSVKVMPSNCLYWYGNECTDVTGGWSTPTATASSTLKFENFDGYSSGHGSVTKTKNINSMYVAANDNSSSTTQRAFGSFYANNPINLSDKSYVTVRFDVTDNATAEAVSRLAFGIYQSIAVGTIANIGQKQMMQLFQGTTEATPIHKLEQVELDAVSKGNYYVNIYAFAARSNGTIGGNIMAIYLE